jgi:hypothetical protein
LDTTPSQELTAVRPSCPNRAIRNVIEGVRYLPLNARARGATRVF